MIKTYEKQNIPSGWQENQLLDCLRVPSKLAGIKLSEYENDGDFPVFDQGQDYISGYSSRKDLIVEDVPAILFGDHTRIVKYIKSPFVAGADGTKIFWAKDGFDPTFLYYLVLSQKIPNTGYNRHFKFFKDIKVVHPKSKTEQQKISEILGTVDEDIAKTQAVIDTTEKLKRGLMQQLFIRGIGHTKFKETKIGQIPEGWEIKTFEEFAVLQRGFDLPVQDRRVGQYDLVTSNGVTDTHAEFKVKGPGVVTGRSGTLGNVFYIENNFWPLNTTLYIKDFHGNHEKFVYYKIQSFDISRFGTGTGVPTLNRNIVHKEIVAVPKYKEQKEIADILSAVDEKISVNKKLKAKLILLKKGLMQDLLSGRVRVN